MPGWQGLLPGKLGFKIGEALVGLRSGTTDTPEAVTTWDGKVHTILYHWNPDTLAFEVATSRGAGTGQEVVVTNLPAEGDFRMESAGGYIYLGWAPAGSSSAAAVWKVARISLAAGVVKVYADGNTQYDNVWDNRASLAY